MASTLERVIEIFKEQDVLGNVEITPTTTLEEAGLDSLDAVVAVVACEEEFGIEIDPDANPTCIAEFVDLVEKALAAKA